MIAMNAVDNAFSWRSLNTNLPKQHPFLSGLRNLKNVSKIALPKFPQKREHKTHFPTNYHAESVFTTPDPPSNPPRPPPPQGSIWHRNRVESGNPSGIDVESMPDRCQIDPERTARRIRGWGPRGLCLISPSQDKYVKPPFANSLFRLSRFNFGPLV